MATIEEVRVPDLGDFHDVPVIEVLVKAGDTVAEEASLLTLESDKAAMDLPSPMAGKIVEIKVAKGSKVNPGDVVALIEPASEAKPANAKPGAGEGAAGGVGGRAPAAARSEPQAVVREDEVSASEHTGGKPAGDRTRGDLAVASPPQPPSSPTAPITGATAYASPAIRRFARELGVDLAKVQGSGRGGRIQREDVQNFVKLSLSHAQHGGGARFALPEALAIDFSKFGDIETRPMSRIKKLTATHLHRAWLTVPHVTQFDEADITDLEAFRQAHVEAAKRRGFKLSPLPFILKACAVTLREYPQFAASLAPSGEELIVKKYCHIGVAVDTPEGLVVPVLRNVERKSLMELASELHDVSQRARDRRLKPEDLQGGVFSVSSLGGIGGTHFTPIVNSPEVAILGVARAETRPVWRDGIFAPRLLLPLALSYDHRVIDGAEGARFITHLARVLADIRALAL
jgi:pyruvate dehydrogenase E2 component (dihydrolipoamide acetyltransferase)